MVQKHAGMMILTCNSLSPPKKTFSIPKKGVPDFSCGTVLCYESRIELRLEGNLGDLYTESGQTLQGSFSAVSTPIFASKYALESSRRDLHNALLCTVLNAQNFRQKSLKILLIFSPNFANFDKFWQFFGDF